MAARGSGGDDELLGVDRRRALLGLGAAALLGLGAVTLLSQVAGLDEALDVVRRAHAPWLAGLAGGQVLAYAGYAVGYRAVARACGGPLLGLWTTLRLTMLSFGAFVLASSAGGLAVDFWALHRAGERVHAAGRRVLAFNILQWLVLASAAWVAAALTLTGLGEGAPPGIAIGWLAAVPACLLPGLWFSSPSRRERLAALPRDEPEDSGSKPGRRARRLWGKVRAAFADAIGALGLVRAVLARPRRYADAPLGFALYWLGDLVTVYAALRALGADVGPTALLLAYVTGYVVSSSPLPAGAAGFAEAAMAGSLAAVGVPFGTAVLAAFLYRLFTFWLPLLPAVAGIAQARKLSDELPRTRREANPDCRVDPERE